jgi:alpha-N-arabinofuranosidase
MGQVAYLDVAGTLNPEDGKVSVFILNRDLTKAHPVEIIWQDKAPGKLLNSTVLTGSDLKAFNSFEYPQRVAPQEFDKPVTSGGRTKFEVPARSYTVIQWEA